MFWFNKKTPRCPSCQKPLAATPQRKTKCPTCGKPIYVKRVPGETEKRLVTEAQAIEIDAQWAARTVERAAGEFCRLFGIDLDHYAAARTTLSGATDPASLRWSTEYFLARERAENEPDHHTRRMLYSHLARLCEEKSLQPEWRDFTTRMHEAELLQHKDSRGAVVGVRIEKGPLPCPACRENANKVFTVDEALAAQPLPCVGCICDGQGSGVSFCRCRYVAVLRGDLENKRKARDDNGPNQQGEKP